MLTARKKILCRPPKPSPSLTRAWHQAATPLGMACPSCGRHYSLQARDGSTPSAVVLLERG
jgi:hypothetical protein